MYGTGEYSGDTTEGLGASGDGYNKFGNTESKYYISSYNISNNTNRVAYNEEGFAQLWWLRSPYLSTTYHVRYVHDSRQHLRQRCGIRPWLGLWLLHPVVLNWRLPIQKKWKQKGKINFYD